MIELAALVRFFHLAAAIFLVGRFAFPILILKSFAPTGARRLVRYGNLLKQWTIVAIVVGLITHVVALGLQIAFVVPSNTGTNSETVTAFLAATRYGNVWFGRWLLLLLLAACCRWMTSNTPCFLIALLLSAGHLMALALSGHAAAAESLWTQQIATHALHLLASGIWLGGLAPLALLLWLAPGASNREEFNIVQHAVRRFSNWALLCVTLLVITGGVNSWNLIGGFAQLFGTPYGQLLIAKLALLLPLLVLATFNLRSFKPNLLRAAAPNDEVWGRNLKGLSRSVLVETALGVGILLIVGHLAITPPARHMQPQWPFSFRWDWSVLETSPKAWAEVQRSAVWGLVGLLAILVAVLRRKRRWLTALLGCGALVYGTHLMHQAVMIDAYPDTYKRPAVAYHAISIANGELLYRESGCAVCHGMAGRGDGPAAAELDPKPPDLIGRHANAHTAGDLFWWLSHGVKPTSAMPGFSESLSVEERWDLINYLRALAGGDRARNLATVIDEEPKLVAPDFSYATSAGEAKTLKDHRGGKVVLLALLDGEKHSPRLQQLAEAEDALTRLGVELIVVPRGGGISNPPRWLVSEGTDEIAATYSLFARSFDEPAVAQSARHAEYLIDKQGYLRARWLPAENEGWRKLAALKQQIELLLKEKPRAPAPDDHVH